MKMYSGIAITIDTHEADGTPLNDSPLEDRIYLAGEDDGSDLLANDQCAEEVSLEYLELRDRMDRMNYAVNGAFA